MKRFKKILLLSYPDTIFENHMDGQALPAIDKLITDFNSDFFCQKKKLFFFGFCSMFIFPARVMAIHMNVHYGVFYM